MKTAIYSRVSTDDQEKKGHDLKPKKCSKCKSPYWNKTKWKG